MLIDVNSQQSGALFKSLVGTSGKSWWETSSYELLKEKLLMWKLMTSIFVEESQKCLRGAPLWAYRIRRVVFFVSWEIPLQLFMVQSTTTRTGLSVAFGGNYFHTDLHFPTF